MSVGGEEDGGSDNISDRTVGMLDLSSTFGTDMVSKGCNTPVL